MLRVLTIKINAVCKVLTLTNIIQISMAVYKFHYKSYFIRAYIYILCLIFIRNVCYIYIRYKTILAITLFVCLTITVNVFVLYINTQPKFI